MRRGVSGIVGILVVLWLLIGVAAAAQRGYFGDDQEVSWTRSTPLNSRGLFAMKIETFKRYYAGMGVAR